jgi:hypothetical protein
MKKESSYKCMHSKEDFLRYLLVRVSPVIAGVKPATLLRISDCCKAREFQHYDSFCAYQEEIMHSLNIEYMVMKNNGIDIQVLFFDSEFMKRRLIAPEVSQLLYERGYGEFESVRLSLDKLRDRFCTMEFPHEIGVFLGYPVKDVRGFINRSEPSVLVNKGLWRVFGDPTVSLHLMKQYRLAENLGRRISAACNNLESCIIQLKQRTL